MKQIVLFTSTLLCCILVGEFFGNPRGGFLAGIILGITVAKRFYTKGKATAKP